jgi:short-subunit dehydrogenase
VSVGQSMGRVAVITGASSGIARGDPATEISELKRQAGGVYRPAVG